MPKRTDISSILVIGAGPIIIGQACEFDYSGTQAIKALKEEGYRVILVNSNPATIMTDPEFADATYIEPITPDIVAKIIAKERPDALLPTMGGQTALNCALDLEKHGVLAKFGVEMIGATADVLQQVGKDLGLKIDLLYGGKRSLALDEVRSGRMDMLADASLTTRQLEALDYIHPALTYNDYLVWTRNGSTLDYSTAQDLIGHVGALSQQARLTQDFEAFAQSQLTLVSTPNLTQAFQKLVLGQVDYVLAGRYSGMAMTQTSALGGPQSVAEAQAILVAELASLIGYQTITNADDTP